MSKQDDDKLAARLRRQQRAGAGDAQDEPGTVDSDVGERTAKTVKTDSGGKTAGGGYTTLRNQFLIATPSLDGGIFKSSVTYLCEHDKNGAMGIIVNRPSNLVVQDILADVCDEQPSEELATGNAAPVLVGGPVGLERGFVLHQLGTHEDPERWASSLRVSDDIVLTGSKDILLALSEGRGPEHYLVVLGYAGWGAGQLEEELASNAWLTSPANADILFSTPYHKRAAAAAKLLGIDLASLASHGGTA
ncbi:MAG: YqgE/AlgH family protein [Gammaproteobacteria bacterium]|nr:YqgE/AlgH family protein [Gammaproteobacteria bacterium]NNM10372.1 YqgE/AlgH family protein [Pseudomonadales bacterium]RZV58558.1 MAG: YqgE/AlgH family protein [Pseudomonadales bacterium]